MKTEFNKSIVFLGFAVIFGLSGLKVHAQILETPALSTGEESAEMCPTDDSAASNSAYEKNNAGSEKPTPLCMAYRFANECNGPHVARSQPSCWVNKDAPACPKGQTRQVPQNITFTIVCIYSSGICKMDTSQKGHTDVIPECGCVPCKTTKK